MEGTMTTTPVLSKSWTQANTTDGPAQQGFGQIVSLNDGGYVVVWMDSSGTYNPFGAAVLGQRFESAGNKVGGEVNLGDVVSGHTQVSPAVTLLDNGNIAVAFNDLFGGDYDIYVRIFDSSLNLVRTDPIDTGANSTGEPSITALAGSSYAVSYTAGLSPNTASW
jgi:large repetitive protein